MSPLSVDDIRAALDHASRCAYPEAFTDPAVRARIRAVLAAHGLVSMDLIDQAVTDILTAIQGDT